MDKLAAANRMKERMESVAPPVVKKEVKTIILSREERDNLREKYEKGVEFFKSGKFDKAVEEWEPVWHRYAKFEKIEDYLVKAYQYWGMEMYTKHNYQEALDIWARILKVDPDNEKAIRYIRKTREELSGLENASD